MPEEPSSEITVARLALTDRLVELPPLRLREARQGAPPRFSTSVRLGWREDRLLVRFDCRHRGIVATLREDNAELWREDVVEAFFSLDDPPIRYLELEVNPLGAKFSAIVDSPRLSREGMTVRTFPFPEFTAEVTVRETRWSARLSIPLGGLASLFGPREAPPRAQASEIPRESELRPRVEEGLRVGRGLRPMSFLANFFRIDRTSGEFSALFPTLADPPDFHLPERFGWFRLTA